MSPVLVPHPLSRLVIHDNRIGIIDRPEVLPRPSHFQQCFVARMPRVEAATYPVADEKGGGFDRLQRIEDFLYRGLGDWAALLAESYEGFFGAVARMAFISPFSRKRDGV